MLTLVPGQLAVPEIFIGTLPLKSSTVPTKYERMTTLIHTYINFEDHYKVRFFSNSFDNFDEPMVNQIFYN